MIREVGTSIGRTVLDGIGRAASRLQERKSLPADLLESDDAYLAVFDGPGATAADVSVRFEGNTVSVTVDRFREFHDGYEMLFPGRGLALEGDVTLPESAAVDPDRAEATITRNGTLEVLIPKVPEGGDGNVNEETSIETDGEEDGETSIDTDDGAGRAT